MSRQSPSMTDAAKEKLQGMWTSIKSMTVDEDRQKAFSKLRKAVEVEGGTAAIENMMKTLFGSCTNGVVDETDMPASLNQKPCQQLSSAQEKEEFFYSQFLSNDRARAAQAVNALREQSGSSQGSNHREQKHSPPTTPRPTRVVPRPFPVSTPPRKDSPQQRQPTEISCQVHDALPTLPRDRAATVSFDDGISAISAHTLDELVRQDELKKQQCFGPVRSDLTSDSTDLVQRKSSLDSSIFPPTTPSRSINYDGEDKLSPLTQPSLAQPLNRSHGSWKSRGNRSLETRETRSTQTTEFETVWRKHEQKYWQGLVEEEEEETKTKTVLIPHMPKRTSRSRDSVSFRCWNDA